MTTVPLSEKRGEERGAVAVETVALIAAAIGLCLSLIVTHGGVESHDALPVERGVQAPV